jgi:CPA2 family monovalent cation:H+ antiporter-2
LAEGDLLVNLAVALTVAWAGALLAVALRQSPIVGYVLGGIVIGPYTPGFVGDAHTVEELANIGVIFLMFAIGVHLSVRDLLKSGTVALVGGTVQMLAMIGIGSGMGLLVGWGGIESVFFGAVLAISSGAVVSRVLSDRGELDAPHGRIAMAWSTVQDLATIVIVVVLTALAARGGNIAVDLGQSLGKAALFLGLLIPIGVFVLPWLFGHITQLQSREVFLLTVAVVALGTAYLSTHFGLSLALGAFAAGLVISEADLGHQILGHVEPLRDVFAGLFFVSIGMLVDPSFVAGHLPLVFAALALIVVAKGAIIALLTAAFGNPLRVALLSGVVMSQAGEFSFLIARLGADRDVVAGDAFNVMLAASAISIVLTGPLLTASEPLAHRLAQRRPPATLHVPELAIGDTAHAVICGYGRAGSIVSEALRRAGIPFVVIEQDGRVVRELRAVGVTALLGQADHPIMLEQAQLQRARVLIIAIPDAYTARRIVDAVHQQHAQLPIVARTHSQTEQRNLEARGASEAVLAETELALEMARFALEHAGITNVDEQIDAARLVAHARSNSADGIQPASTSSSSAT